MSSDTEGLCMELSSMFKRVRKLSSMMPDAALEHACAYEKKSSRPGLVSDTSEHATCRALSFRLHLMGASAGQHRYFDAIEQLRAYVCEMTALR